jgi:hypothetical protein
MFLKRDYPKQAIVSVEPVGNVWDSHGAAAKAHLVCGHFCILTGAEVETVPKRGFVGCYWCDKAEQERPALLNRLWGALRRHS